MRANTPDELPRVFAHHLNRGDIDGLMQHYYAPDATYAPVPGHVVQGADLEHAIGRLVALEAPIEVSVRHVLRSGEIALVVLDWNIEDAGMSGTATDVARLQPDGAWRCVVDNPHGGARTVDLPPATANILAG